MRTPAGFECKYFYGNYFRGRKQEECRLIGNTPPPHHWTPDLCSKCPVPDILRANSCPNMELRGKGKHGILGLGRGVEVSAYCNKSQQFVNEPQIGCGLCHPLPPEFMDKNQ
jgi:hypothetical protein